MSANQGEGDGMHPPSIDSLLRLALQENWALAAPRALLTQCVRAAVAEARQADPPEFAAAALLAATRRHLERALLPSLRPVLNATGVILHTNLGRAPLSARALRRMAEIGRGYCNLELDLDTGRRGQRDQHLEELLLQLTGAEAALAVNNCSAAMALIVDGLARDREVVVSRGELVEIGGSFRIPELLSNGGAQLVEVGTTNRTYTEDFARALGERTGMLLSTHLSNFWQQGFVHRPEPAELVQLARAHGIPSVLDLGTGLLEARGHEPSVAQAVAQGWDLVAFSGDKLLGSAQAGLVVGKREWIAKLRTNPWMRALRLDKLRLAALEASLLDQVLEPGALPTQAMLNATPAELESRARQLAEDIGRRLGPDQVRIEVRSSQASIGGGTTPDQQLESWAVCLQPVAVSLEVWCETLRWGEPALLGRKHQDWLWLDVRTLFLEESAPLLGALQRSL